MSSYRAYFTDPSDQGDSERLTQVCLFFFETQCLMTLCLRRLSWLALQRRKRLERGIAHEIRKMQELHHQQVSINRH